MRKDKQVLKTFKVLVNAYLVYTVSTSNAQDAYDMAERDWNNRNAPKWFKDQTVGVVEIESTKKVTEQ